MVEPSLLAQVLQLPVGDREELMQEIADSLPLPRDVRALLDERIADLEARPHDHQPWSVVRAELLERHLA